MSMSAPLFGLILAGGASTRMQRDKATLAYHDGQTQLQWTYDLVSQVCDATFVSVRPDQRDEPARAAFPQIVDLQPGSGPIAGISAALAQHRKAAWLVVACDLPFLTTQTLQYLIAARDHTRIATAFRSAHDSLPEPLCAIWEPAAREPLRAHLDAGKQCPRKFLINADTLLIDLPDARSLDNVNTVSDFATASEALRARPLTRATRDLSHEGRGGDGDGGTSSFPLTRAARDLSREGRGEDGAKSFPSPLVGEGQGEGDASAQHKAIRVQYFALFREQAGRSEESIESTAATPADLYRELQTRYPFQLAPEQLKVAINSDFADWDSRLKHGDTIVFIPPVAGG